MKSALAITLAVLINIAGVYLLFRSNSLSLGGMFQGFELFALLGIGALASVAYFAIRLYNSTERWILGVQAIFVGFFGLFLVIVFPFYFCLFFQSGTCS